MAGGAGTEPCPARAAASGTCQPPPPPSPPLPRAVLDLATLALRDKKESQVTLDHPGPSLGTLMAQWWSRSLVPPGHRGKTEPLAGMASL